MIEINNLTKRFEDVVAVNALTLFLQPGITGLVGENGAGKSTLMRLISGVLLPEEGEIRIDGENADSQKGKAKVFFLSDDPYAPQGAGIKGVYDFYACFYDIDKDRFDGLIEKFGLPLDRKVAGFSKGMRRQLFLALSLSVNAPYLLLDEAFDGLDPLLLEKLKDEMLEEASKGKTILASSHNVTALQRLVDHYVFLYKGKLSTQEESVDLGSSFVKFQAAFKEEVTKEQLIALGLDVIAFKKVGSVTNFVCLEQEGIEEKVNEAFPSLFLESIPLDAEETIILQLTLAEREADHE